MIWLFDRNGEKIRYEINRDRRLGLYRIVTTGPDGSESIEEVHEPNEVITRSLAFMHGLKNQGWRFA